MIYNGEPFRAIVCDPPWPERGGGRIRRGANRHYDLLRAKEIPGVMRDCPYWRPAEDAHLYLWATDNHLEDALWVMREVGFRYVRTVQWIKLKNEAFSGQAIVTNKSLEEYLNSLIKRGMGQYFRGASEMLLLGVKGKGRNVCTARRDLANVILGPRGKHSEKPEIAYALIQQRSLGPYLEMFSRGERPGWTCWGRQRSSEISTGIAADTHLNNLSAT